MKSGPIPLNPPYSSFFTKDSLFSNKFHFHFLFYCSPGFSTLICCLFVDLFVVFEGMSTDLGAVVAIDDVRLLDCEGKILPLQVFGRVPKIPEQPSGLNNREAGNSLCNKPPGSDIVQSKLGVDVLAYARKGTVVFIRIETRAELLDRFLVGCKTPLRCLIWGHGQRVLRQFAQSEATVALGTRLAEQPTKLFGMNLRPERK